MYMCVCVCSICSYNSNFIPFRTHIDVGCFKNINTDRPWLTGSHSDHQTHAHTRHEDMSRVSRPVNVLVVSSHNVEAIWPWLNQLDWGPLSKVLLFFCFVYVKIASRRTISWSDMVFFFKLSQRAGFRLSVGLQSQTNFRIRLIEFIFNHNNLLEK